MRNRAYNLSTVLTPNLTGCITCPLPKSAVASSNESSVPASSYVTSVIVQNLSRTPTSDQFFSMWGLLFASLISSYSGTDLHNHQARFSSDSPSYVGCYYSDVVENHREYYTIETPLPWNESVAFCNHRLVKYMALKEDESDRILWMGKLVCRDRLLSRSIRNNLGYKFHHGSLEEEEAGAPVKAAWFSHALIFRLAAIDSYGAPLTPTVISHQISTFAVSDVQLLDIYKVAQV
ncbi:hypothetical protein J6590_065950 [Homalodisca vitripennis]|nr:hypothetical protein J6590_065950 [Homalodisca vitripennis]